ARAAGRDPVLPQRRLQLCHRPISGRGWGLFAYLSATFVAVDMGSDPAQYSRVDITAIAAQIVAALQREWRRRIGGGCTETEQRFIQQRRKTCSKDCWRR